MLELDLMPLLPCHHGSLGLCGSADFGLNKIQAMRLARSKVRWDHDIVCDHT